MSTTYIAMIVAILIGIGLLVTIGALSLLSGALNFLFVRPKLELLKSTHGDQGLAFTFKWDQDAEPVEFNRIRVHLFNPFGSPTEVDITRDFDGSSTDFARDLELGAELKKIITATNLEKSTIEIEVVAIKDNVTRKTTMKGSAFLEKRNAATQTVEDVASKFVIEKITPKFEIPERSFISPPLPKTAKQLKMATNPMFAGEFAGAVAGGGTAAPAVENFSITKVWIEPGCIVCDACEAIFPEVFEVTDSTCIIRPGAPLNDGLRIQESAEACPVEVIKFTKAG
ncbi:MAG: ferredoxin [Bdellovibrionales bacterium]|nr:ferredoxin [Bdellovibrionales bacterium]